MTGHRLFIEWVDGTRPKRIVMSCCGEQSPGGDFWDASYWVGKHFQTNKASSDRLVRAAERKPK